MNKSPFVSFLFFCLLLIFFGTGCAPHRPVTSPELDRQAAALSDKARALNMDILTSKGFGWAVTKTPEGNRRYRIAWAAAWPNQTRITFMVFGKPIETVTATGESVTFFSHTGRHPTYTVASADPSMEPVANLPVKLSEIISILLGRLPLKPFHDTFFSPADPSLSTITLFDKNRGPVQEIGFDAESVVSRIKAVDSRLETRYEYRIEAFKQIGGKRIPVRITVTDNQGQFLYLTITRFIPNPDIKPHVFELTEGG